jgi:NitT/TauT family transport system substrate-binding protein/putative hydroxymethylpyrimidine transport system substrate-binding protein
MRRIVALLATALLLAGVAGCGGGGAEPSGPQGATLVLDFTPNAVHTGIYAAEAEGFYRKAGVDLQIQQPGQSSDAPKLLAAGRTDFAVLDIHDLGIARERGLDLVGVMPIVHRALASVLTRYYGDVGRPRDLEGRTVGVTGLPSDDAVVDAEVAADGGDPAKVKKVTIGFNAVSALAAKKVDAVTAFWNAEGVELQRMNVPIHEFIVDKYGAPKYPELVLATSRDLLESDPDLVAAVVGATMRGYALTQEDLAKALEDLLAANPGLDEAEQRERLTFVGPYIHPAPFNPAILREWAAWDLENGILEEPLDVAEAFDVELARAEQPRG